MYNKYLQKHIQHTTVPCTIHLVCKKNPSLHAVTLATSIGKLSPPKRRNPQGAPPVSVTFIKSPLPMILAPQLKTLQRQSPRNHDLILRSIRTCKVKIQQNLGIFQILRAGST